MNSLYYWNTSANELTNSINSYFINHEYQNQLVVARLLVPMTTSILIKMVDLDTLWEIWTKLCTYCTCLEKWGPGTVGWRNEIVDVSIFFSFGRWFLFGVSFSWSFLLGVSFGRRRVPAKALRRSSKYEILNAVS